MKPRDSYLADCAARRQRRLAAGIAGVAVLAAAAWWALDTMSLEGPAAAKAPARSELVAVSAARRDGDSR